MLTFYILNVGHGDSTVIRYDSPNGPIFGLIDSNTVRRDELPALGKLRQLGADELSFIAITHPHVDHFKGLADLMVAYEGRIGALYTFPLHRTVPGRVHKLGQICQRLYERTDNPTIRGGLLELVKILKFAKTQLEDEWHEPTGMRSRIAPPGFAGVEINILSPLPKEKGAYFTAIEHGRLDVLTDREAENRLSLAFEVTYAGRTVIIGGDATYNNWLDQKRQLDRAGLELAADVVRLPHHGAKEDCKAFVLDHLFRRGEDRYALISANGHSHPSPDTYAALEERRIAPYCTNLAEQCGALLRDEIQAPELDPVLGRLLNSIAEQPASRGMQPCQGDIRLQISPAGVIEIFPQHANPCPYRGGYYFLDLLPGPDDAVH